MSIFVQIYIQPLKPFCCRRRCHRRPSQKRDKSGQKGPALGCLVHPHPPLGLGDVTVTVGGCDRDLAKRLFYHLLRHSADIDDPISSIHPLEPNPTRQRGERTTRPIGQPTHPFVNHTPHYSFVPSHPLPLNSPFSGTRVN